MKNFVKKLGATASLAAVFGLVSSGVFVGVTKAADTNQAVVAEAESGTESQTQSVITPTPSAGNVNTLQKDGSTNASSTSVSTAQNGSMSIADIAKMDMPSMVAITNTSVQEVENYFGGYGFFGFGPFGSQGQPRSYEAVSMGSGVIIGIDDEQITIVTNQHVIADSETLSVAFADESAASATVLGEDASTDLAVIAVSTDDVEQETLDAISALAIGSSDDLIVGEDVVAIGNALGYGQSVSAGIVSALHRELTAEDGSTEGTEGGLIQTDAAINPGNSGGALLNMKGELIGINSAKYAQTEVEGMGFAIPITEALPIISDLKEGKSPEAEEAQAELKEGGAYLGITCTTVSESYAQYYGIPAGVYINTVEEGGAAANAGMREGDIITAIDDTTITDVESLTKALANYESGDTATVTLSRESKASLFSNSGSSYVEGQLTVTFGERPAVKTSAPKTTLG